MKTLIQKALRSRADIFQLGAVAVLLGLGVNLFASWLGDYLLTVPAYKWITGSRLECLVAVLLILLGLLFFIIVLLRDRVLEREVEGVMLFDKKKKELIPIEGYDFSEELHHALRAAFVENQALRAALEAEPLFARFGVEKPNDGIDKREADDDKEVSYVAITRMESSSDDRPISEKSVLTEALEFYVLESLSTHLSGHFDQMDGCDSEVVELSREDIPEILLQNRILSLLSTPIEDRQIFITSKINKKPPQGEIVALHASSGAQYNRFDLSLPKGTKVLRPTSGTIRLEHKRFALEVRITFHGFTKNLPPYFEKLYVGVDDEAVDAREVKFHIRGQLRRRSLLLFSGWQYYNWIDSFFDHFEEEVAFDGFLQRIDWISVARESGRV